MTTTATPVTTPGKPATKQGPNETRYYTDPPSICKRTPDHTDLVWSKSKGQWLPTESIAAHMAGEFGDNLWPCTETEARQIAPEAF